MIKTVDFYYCDRCGKEIDKEEYEKNVYIDFHSSVHKVCSVCHQEFIQKQKELINWLEMNGKALALKVKKETISEGGGKCQDN